MIQALVSLLALGVHTASAAPLSPASLQPVPFTFELTGVLSTDRTYLHSPGCTGEACSAIRRELWQGGEGSLWVIPQLGFYGGLAHVTEGTAAATYTGDGFRAQGGVKGGVALSSALGLNGWASFTHTETNTTNTTKTASPTNTVDSSVPTTSDQARRNQLELGAVLRAGQSDGGIDGWVGVEAMPWCLDLTRVVQGDAKVALKPFIPVSAVVGVRMFSDPLGGPWTKRGRVSVGVTGELGYRIGVTGWLTASL